MPTSNTDQRLHRSEIPTMTQQLTTLIHQAEALPIADQLTLIAHLIQWLKSMSEQVLQPTPPEASETTAPGKTHWKLANDFTANLPDETVTQLPQDGAAEHDNYIYGMPKDSY